MGAYLPVDRVLKAILDKERGLGFEGWVSSEVFSADLRRTGSGVAEESAERAWMAWVRMGRDMRFEVQ